MNLFEETEQRAAKCWARSRVLFNRDTDEASAGADWPDDVADRALLDQVPVQQALKSPTLNNTARCWASRAGPQCVRISIPVVRAKPSRQVWLRLIDLANRAGHDDALPFHEAIQYTQYSEFAEPDRQICTD